MKAVWVLLTGTIAVSAVAGAHHFSSIEDQPMLTFERKCIDSEFLIERKVLKRNGAIVVEDFNCLDGHSYGANHSYSLVTQIDLIKSRIESLPVGGYPFALSDSQFALSPNEPCPPNIAMYATKADGSVVYLNFSEGCLLYTWEEHVSVLRERDGKMKISEPNPRLKTLFYLERVIGDSLHQDNTSFWTQI